jgi:hypothetical protein
VEGYRPRVIVQSQKTRLGSFSEIDTYAALFRAKNRPFTLQWPLIYPFMREATGGKEERALIFVSLLAAVLRASFLY